MTRANYRPVDRLVDYPHYVDNKITSKIINISEIRRCVVTIHKERL